MDSVNCDDSNIIQIFTLQIKNNEENWENINKKIIIIFNGNIAFSKNL